MSLLCGLWLSHNCCSLLVNGQSNFHFNFNYYGWASNLTQIGAPTTMLLPLMMMMELKQIMYRGLGAYTENVKLYHH